MSLREINFDGIVGPSHNYAGLSLGNLASTRNAGDVSQPRAAALQGIEKMRANLELGLAQGVLLPHPRPDHAWLAELGTSAERAEPPLFAAATSASSTTPSIARKRKSWRGTHWRSRAHPGRGSGSSRASSISASSCGCAAR